MIKLPKPQAILFDWDNTLVDTWPCISKAVNITLERMGHEIWSETEIRERVAGSLRDTFPKIYGDRWEEAREIFYESFAAVHLEMLRVLPGADALVRTINAKGVYLGVVSNKVGQYLRAEALHLGWMPLFGKIVGAQDAARDKPTLDPVHLALDGSGLRLGSHIWFVGDADIDVECGRAGGCTTIFAHAERHEGKHKPDLYVKDCHALQNVFDIATAS